MANNLSKELTKQVVDLYINKKYSIQKIATELKINRDTVSNYLSSQNLNRRKQSYYSKETLDEIKRLYVEEGLGSTTIGRKLNMKERTVVCQLQKMGIPIRGTKRTYDHDLIKKLYVEDKIPIHMIAKQLGSSESTISKILRQNGVEIYGHGIPRFNYHIFDSVDTEEKAYWLGFIYADGYIATINPDKPNYAFELSLKVDDYPHLEKFNKFMEFNGDNVKIGKCGIYKSSKVTDGIIYQERCRWNISNKHLWETLNSYGCTPRKSYTLQFPNINIFKDLSLIRHFIRGYFDGDGSISFFDKEHTLPTFMIASKSKDIVEKIISYLPGNLNLHFSDKMWVINTCKNKAMNIFRYLYKNSTIYLDRKYERFMYFCRLDEESSKLLQTNIGESCDVNPEISTETKESVPSYSVGIEPKKLE